jgi:hypothetical protein
MVAISGKAKSREACCRCLEYPPSDPSDDTEENGNRVVPGGVTIGTKALVEAVHCESRIRQSPVIHCSRIVAWYLVMVIVIMQFCVCTRTVLGLLCSKVARFTDLHGLVLIFMKMSDARISMATNFKNCLRSYGSTLQVALHS